MTGPEFGARTFEARATSFTHHLFIFSVSSFSPLQRLIDQKECLNIPSSSNLNLCFKDGSDISIIYTVLACHHIVKDGDL